MPDGRHYLVFLSPVPAAEDEGKIAVLPDGPEGQTVDLRATFIASGCYEFGTTTPLWTAPWDDTDDWSVSYDCRYLIRRNYFSDHKFMHGDDNVWAIKFFDRGHEIKSYTARDLLDFPSLTRFTSWDSSWWDWDRGDETILSRSFDARTVTREQYRFDITSGQIVEEHHVWRPLAHICAALLATLCGGAAMWIVRRHRLKEIAAETIARPLPISQLLAECDTRKQNWLSFSTRQFFGFTAAAAVVCWIGFRWPHVLVFLTSLWLAIILTRDVVGMRRSIRLRGGSAMQKLSFGLLLTPTIVMWLACYLLSAAPAFALLRRFNVPEDVFSAIALTIYRPVMWLGENSQLLRSEVLEWYGNAWGLH